VTNLPYNLFYSCVFSTLGEIYKNIRVISISYNSDLKYVMMRVYLDRIPTEYDTDAACEISSYIADAVTTYKYIIDCIEEECIFSDEPYDQMEIEGHMIYARREYDLEDDKNGEVRKLSWPSGLSNMCSSASRGVNHDHINIMSMVYNAELRHIKINIYFDRNPTDDDRAIAHQIGGNLIKDDRSSQYANKIEKECIFCNKPYKEMNIEGEIIHLNRKYAFGEDIYAPLSSTKILPHELFHICVCATFGEIYKNIRIVEIIYSPELKHVVMHVYLDRVPTDYDAKATRTIALRVANDVRTGKYVDKIEEKCIFCDKPYGFMKTYGCTIYQRRQYSLENPQYDFENG